MRLSCAVLTVSEPVKQHRGPTHLCGEVIRALQTSPKLKALWSAERDEEREREGERRGREGGSEEEGGRLSRFIARSREASTEHSFNQTVTSPPGAAQRLENRSLLGSLPCLRFCSHAPRLSSVRSAGSDETVVLYPGVSERKKKTSATTIRQTSCLRLDMKQNTGVSFDEFHPFPRILANTF